MANIDKLKESVKKAEAKVEKCKGTIERHQKALEKKINVLVKLGYSLETILGDINSIKWPVEGKPGGRHYWEACEVTSKMEDIKGAKRKLEDAEEVLANWNAKLKKEEAKDNFVKDNAPKAIVEFLEKWKEMAYDWHVKRCEEALELKETLKKEVAHETAVFESSLTERYYHWSKLDSYLKEKKLDSKSVGKKVARKAGSSAVLAMMDIKDETVRLEWLDKLLEEDKRAKLIDLIHRVTTVVGEITDASFLKVNDKGNLDGIITGTEGKAEVETIGAGGYNIVCFHYRTLVKPMMK